MFGGATALAATAVVPSVAMATVTGGGDRARLAAALAKGAPIENEHFEFFDGKPVMIGGDAPFRLRNCKFTWHGKAPGGYLGFTRRNSGEMIDCRFEHASGAKRAMVIRKI